VIYIYLEYISLYSAKYTIMFKRLAHKRYTEKVASAILIASRHLAYVSLM
jgi:hypothetical protein